MGPASVQEGGDDPCEVVPSPVQPALHRPEVAAGDVRDILVGLPLQFPEDENNSMVLRKLSHGLLYQLLQMPFPEEVIGLELGVFPLQGPMVWKRTRGFRERFRSSFFARLLAMV